MPPSGGTSGRGLIFELGLRRRLHPCSCRWRRGCVREKKQGRQRPRGGAGSGNIRWFGKAGMRGEGEIADKAGRARFGMRVGGFEYKAEGCEFKSLVFL